jgi:hypothetical protein
MAARLGMLAYLSIIFTFFFDLMLIGTVFTNGEIYGILVILAANLFSAYGVFYTYFLKSQ